MAGVSGFLRVRLEDFSTQKVSRATLKYSLTKTTSLSGLIEEGYEEGHAGFRKARNQLGYQTDVFG